MTGQPDTPAGGPRANDNALRYELVAKAPVRSGSSADPLAQAPVPIINPLQQLHAGRSHYQEQLATTDTLGERPNASPRVNPKGWKRKSSFDADTNLLLIFL